MPNIIFRVTEAEKQSYTAKAKRLGIPLAQLIRLGLEHVEGGSIAVVEDSAPPIGIKPAPIKPAPIAPVKKERPFRSFFKESMKQ